MIAKQCQGRQRCVAELDRACNQNRGFQINTHPYNGIGDRKLLLPSTELSTYFVTCMNSPSSIPAGVIAVRHPTD